MQKSIPPPEPTSELLESPLYLIAVLYSARKSKDRPLERLTRRRLDALGVRIVFGDELSTPPPANGVQHAR